MFHTDKMKGKNQMTVPTEAEEACDQTHSPFLVTTGETPSTAADKAPEAHSPDTPNRKRRRAAVSEMRNQITGGFYSHGTASPGQSNEANPIQPGPKVEAGVVSSKSPSQRHTPQSPTGRRSLEDSNPRRPGAGGGARAGGVGADRGPCPPAS